MIIKKKPRLSVASNIFFLITVCKNSTRRNRTCYKISTKVINSNTSFCILFCTRIGQTADSNYPQLHTLQNKIQTRPLVELQKTESL